MNENPNTHTLLITDTKGTRKVALKELKYTLGRDISNNISINSKYVSRQHAVLLRIPGSIAGTHLYRIIDGDLSGKPSVNGVIINGNTKVASYELSHGDVISLAPDAQITYLIGETVGMEVSKIGRHQNTGGSDESDTLINEIKVRRTQ
ncbi:FHA domain-containing protein [Synechococcus sp. PCC 7502]|uniref:FHA domain-containing protein n=1 Tax=Synechococcus sp. PCC 7502 TaxID=1173263 RepID=UPI00029FBD40|nr:FHA domain-containing protein [Synechococcus sp. PCC 7502]AFY73699.1 FHA domain-containing protein [Synechococcus sp. PCC 7502]